MADQEFDMHALECQYAVKAAQERLDHVISTLRYAVRDLETYREKLDEAASLEGKAKVLNWALGHAAGNILGNCRLDMLADSQAELTRLHHQA